MTKGKKTTAAELLARLQADPEHQRMRREQDEAIRHRQMFRAQAEKQLVEELRGLGLQVDSVWDLVGATGRYDSAIPVLVRHLREGYPDKVREGIARALSIPVLGPEEWRVILALFREERAGEVKWAMGLALAANAREEHLPELMDLVTDPAQGVARTILAEALYRWRTPEVETVLRTLTSDPEIGASMRRLLEKGTTLS